MTVASNKVFEMALAEFRYQGSEVTGEFRRYLEVSWRVVPTKGQLKAVQLQFTEPSTLLLIKQELDKEINKHSSTSHDLDGTKIGLCKEHARKAGLHYQFLLKSYRPGGALNRPVWNEYGDPVSWEKMYR